MKSVSDAYKQVMSSSIRNRGYVSVALSVINQKAQSNATVDDSTVVWWSKPNNMLHKINNQIDYATIEENFMRANGKLLFLPDYDYKEQIRSTAFISDNICGSAVIDLNGTYQIKGLTIHFSDNYPSKFAVITDSSTFNYTNDSPVFTTNDYLGNISKITISASEMAHGQQRLRINNILFGVGLSFTNESLYDVNFSAYVNPISSELSSQSLSLKIIDLDDNFNVDNNASFAQFLKEGQEVCLSYGIELSEGNIEWIDAAKLYLSSWQSNHGNLIINAKDKISFLTNLYSKGFKIYTRTAYDEALSIFGDIGLEPDEYEIDNCLRDITLTNPMPIMTHAECLQLLCNACRCVLLQDNYGILKIKANFETIINPDKTIVSATEQAEWSNPNSSLKNSYQIYADFSLDNIKADGHMLFFPDNEQYVTYTGYVSALSSDDGMFEINPTIEYDFGSEFNYHGLYITFLETPPLSFVIQTYNSNNEIIKKYTVKNPSRNMYVDKDFLGISKIKLYFTETKPFKRVILSNFSFRGFSDYSIDENVLLSYPVGYKEKPAKSLNVKICTFELDSEGNPVMKDDNVWNKVPIFNDGDVYKVENPLISTTNHAILISEWLSNYYLNNTTYDAEYRGDPRLDANDIVYLYSNVVSNLQVRIEELNLKFNGTFSGSLSLRKEIKY